MSSGILKSYMMPIAMTVGVIFYKQVSTFALITPFLIGLMLFLTYCNIDYRRIKFSKFHFVLIAIQLLGSIAAYLVLLPVNHILAQGAMICILAPTATAAPVVTGMLGGDVESLSTYSLFCNILIAFVAPICFAFMGNVDANSFWHAVLIIGEKVFALLLFPFVLAYILGMLLPSAHRIIRKWKSCSLYLWSIALIIITGQTVKFVIEQGSGHYFLEIGLGLTALFVCVGQFVLGRYVGRRYGNTIAGGQGLGQKNTILAIWMALTYLNPIASVAPGAYVLWQNVINSYQVWRIRKQLV